ncbi:hypothetical protein AAER97_04505, partial [Acinetobacter baumannii]|uniref:hypothetical protein n=1 Tax=Acinetobacter baumannii TaxID=470 RepID=UPI0031F46544
TDEALGKLLWFGAKKALGKFSFKYSLCLYSDSRRVHQQIFHRKVITKSSPEICPGSAEVRDATLQQRN